MSDTNRCLNCGGSEYVIKTRTRYRDPLVPDLEHVTVCRDCTHLWGEPPTRECPGCHDCNKQIGQWNGSLCGGTGRIDVSHLPLCSICRRRHGSEVRHG